MIVRLLLLVFLFHFQVRASKQSRPNVILIITDDQDIELGSLAAMPRTVRLLKERGVSLFGYSTTPICCPSRSSILTGLYAHNHNVHTNNNNCSGPEWRFVHEQRTIGVYGQKEGYSTAYYGKYLNEYDGSYVPPGWDDWHGLIHNSRFYNYTLNVNGDKRKFGFEYEKDYLTDVVTNRSIEFIDRVATRKGRPFLLVLSYPAPHGPEDAAPQYTDSFLDIDSHRTPAWNYAPNPDKQWLLQRTGKMEPVHVAFTDLLHRRRLQTLQSVDEGVERIIQLLRDKSVLSSTYLIFTSDHGYHLGQFGLIKGKNMPYEFDIRVPFFIRGPGIQKNTTIRKPVANIDIAPTIVDMMGGKIPEKMDGRSMLGLISEEREEVSWRETLLIERGKMPRMKSIRDRLERQKDRFSKRERVRMECKKKKWQQECTPGQIFRCVWETTDWLVKRCDKGRECNCPSRGKRSNEEVEENETHEYSDLLDEFILIAHTENVKEGNEWFQGTFDIQSSVRTKRNTRRCNCDQQADNSIIPSYDLYNLESTPFPYSKRSCTLPQMSCFSHGASHWRTPPFWPVEYGQFCFCQNSNNNTYWCLRTLNDTHNFLYCEFVTEFISYYDLNFDPFQLSNAVFSLGRHILEQLSAQLTLLRSCSSANCK
uniref:Sulfatase N-terminal domain-containing protein n=1 Tax=Pristionchus pacificus TaxID=54126 RepID=A0A8R1V4T6_PRIPA